MTYLLVDADSLVDKFSKVLPRQMVDTLLLRLVYKVKMLHFPDKTVVYTARSRTLPFINVHNGSDTLHSIITQTTGVEQDTIVLSADPQLLGLTAYKILCYEPSENWLEPVEITHGRLKKRIGHEPRDHDIIQQTTYSTDIKENKKITAAIGRTRKQRWAKVEEALEYGANLGVFFTIAENVHIKVGRAGFQNYEVIQDVAEFARKLEQVDDLGWDTETTGLDWMKDSIVGESFSFDGKHGYYLPMRHQITGMAYHNNSAQQVEDIIHPLLNKRKLRGANLGFDVLMGADKGLGFPKRLYDVQGYAYMQGMHVPDPSQLGLKALTRNVLGDVMEEYAAVSQGGTFDQVPIDRAAPYAADDAVKSYKLIDVLASKLTPQQLQRYEEICMPLLYTCIRMSYNGMYLDMDELQPLLATLDYERQMAESHIIAYAGHPLNVNSPVQLRTVLFEELGLPPTPLTKSGVPSTGSEHLERLNNLHPIVDELITYRELTKLVNTYLDKYPTYIKEDGRIHSSLNPFKVITGRLSSTNPNLMNIPVRSVVGAQIRKLFAAQHEDYLLSCDASQLEYRVLAHYTDNKALIEAFCDPSRDIHNTTASLIFNKPEHEITKAERDIAKTAFYAILYGASAPRIARTLNISIGEAGAILAKIRANIPEIDELKKEVIEKVRQVGYVESYLGHRSYIYGLFSRNSGERESAERSAFDALFQGTGSGDITALATIRVQQLLDEKYPTDKYGLRPPVILVQQIHDELLLEGSKDALEELGPQVSQIFRDTVSLKVPIVSSWDVGKKWGDIH